MKKDKRVFVLWSGGLDSTALINYYLGQGYKVEAGYVKLLNNETKSVMELQAIEKLLVFLKPYSFKYLGVINETLTNSGSCTFNQLPHWIMSLVYMNNELNNYDEMSIGYIMNDDIISYLSDIQKLWKSYSPFCTGHAKLKFPLIRWNKASIKSSLNDDVFKETVWCENPLINGDKYVPCRHCNSCTRRLTFDNNFFNQCSNDSNVLDLREDPDPNNN